MLSVRQGGQQGLLYHGDPRHVPGGAAGSRVCQERGRLVLREVQLPQVHHAGRGGKRHPGLWDFRIVMIFKEEFLCWKYRRALP